MQRNRVTRSPLVFKKLFKGLFTGSVAGIALVATLLLSLGCANGEFRPKDP
jgi:hypothetical protein